LLLSSPYYRGTTQSVDKIDGLRCSVISDRYIEVPHRVIVCLEYGGLHAIEIQKGPFRHSKRSISFFKRLPLFDQYPGRYGANNESKGTDYCDSYRRICDAVIGLCCLIISSSVFGYSVCYGIYKARSCKQYTIAAIAIVGFFQSPFKEACSC
jgi:hypothetical protein